LNNSSPIAGMELEIAKSNNYSISAKAQYGLNIGAKALIIF
jgi:hypothetical protein